MSQHDVSTDQAARNQQMMMLVLAMTARKALAAERVVIVLRLVVVARCSAHRKGAANPRLCDVVAPPMWLPGGTTNSVSLGTRRAGLSSQWRSSQPYKGDTFGLPSVAPAYHP